MIRDTTWLKRHEVYLQTLIFKSKIFRMLTFLETCDLYPISKPKMKVPGISYTVILKNSCNQLLLVVVIGKKFDTWLFHLNFSIWNSRPGVFFEAKMFLIFFFKIHMKTALLDLIFNKTAGLQACNVHKKWLQHRCIPVNIAKIFRTLLKNIYEWLLRYVNLFRYTCISMYFVCIRGHVYFFM